MKKVFVKVNADFSPEGIFTPKSFVWEDGVSYDIDRVYDCKKAASLKVGGQGMRYRCRVMEKKFIFSLKKVAGLWRVNRQ